MNFQRLHSEMMGGNFGAIILPSEEALTMKGGTGYLDTFKEITKKDLFGNPLYVGAMPLPDGRKFFAFKVLVKYNETKSVVAWLCLFQRYSNDQDFWVWGSEKVGVNFDALLRQPQGANFEKVLALLNGDVVSDGTEDVSYERI